MMNYGNKNGLIKLSIVKLEPSTNFTDDNQPILSPLSKDHKTPKVARTRKKIAQRVATITRSIDANAVKNRNDYDYAEKIVEANLPSVPSSKSLGSKADLTEFIIQAPRGLGKDRSSILLEESNFKPNARHKLSAESLHEAHLLSDKIVPEVKVTQIKIQNGAQRISFDLESVTHSPLMQPVAMPNPPLVAVVQDYKAQPIVDDSPKNPSKVVASGQISQLAAISMMSTKNKAKKSDMRSSGKNSPVSKTSHYFPILYPSESDLQAVTTAPYQYPIIISTPGKQIVPITSMSLECFDRQPQRGFSIAPFSLKKNLWSKPTSPRDSELMQKAMESAGGKKISQMTPFEIQKVQNYYFRQLRDERQQQTLTNQESAEQLNQCLSVSDVKVAPIMMKTRAKFKPRAIEEPAPIHFGLETLRDPERLARKIVFCQTLAKAEGSFDQLNKKESLYLDQYLPPAPSSSPLLLQDKDIPLVTASNNDDILHHINTASEKTEPERSEQIDKAPKLKSDNQLILQIEKKKLSIKPLDTISSMINQTSESSVAGQKVVEGQILPTISQKRESLQQIVTSPTSPNMMNLSQMKMEIRKSEKPMFDLESEFNIPAQSPDLFQGYLPINSVQFAPPFSRKKNIPPTNIAQSLRLSQAEQNPVEALQTISLTKRRQKDQTSPKQSPLLFPRARGRYQSNRKANAHQRYQLAGNEDLPAGLIVSRVKLANQLRRNVDSQSIEQLLVSFDHLLKVVEEQRSEVCQTDYASPVPLVSEGEETSLSFLPPKGEVDGSGFNSPCIGTQSNRTIQARLQKQKKEDKMERELVRRPDDLKQSETPKVMVSHLNPFSHPHKQNKTIKLFVDSQAMHTSYHGKTQSVSRNSDLTEVCSSKLMQDNRTPEITSREVQLNKGSEINSRTQESELKRLTQEKIKINKAKLQQVNMINLIKARNTPEQVDFNVVGSNPFKSALSNPSHGMTLSALAEPLPSPLHPIVKNKEKSNTVLTVQPFQQTVTQFEEPVATSTLYHPDHPMPSVQEQQPLYLPRLHQTQPTERTALAHNATNAAMRVFDDTKLKHLKNPFGRSSKLIDSRRKPIEKLLGPEIMAQFRQYCSKQ